MEAHQDVRMDWLGFEIWSGMGLLAEKDSENNYVNNNESINNNKKKERKDRTN